MHLFAYEKRSSGCGSRVAKPAHIEIKMQIIRVDPPTPGMWVTTNVYHVQNGVHFISPSLDINMKSWVVLVEAGLIVIPWANQKSIIFLYWPIE